MSEPRVTGEVLAKRCSIPALILDGGYLLKLAESGEWSVQTLHKGHVMEDYDHHREGDTGKTTEWIVYPEWSSGVGMTVDLARGQAAIIDRVSDHQLRVRVFDYSINLDGEEKQILDATYSNCILIVREQTARPVAPTNYKEIM